MVTRQTLQWALTAARCGRAVDVQGGGWGIEPGAGGAAQGGALARPLGSVIGGGGGGGGGGCGGCCRLCLWVSEEQFGSKLNTAGESRQSNHSRPCPRDTAAAETGPTRPPPGAVLPDPTLRVVDDNCRAATGRVPHTPATAPQAHRQQPLQHSLPGKKVQRHRQRGGQQHRKLVPALGLRKLRLELQPVLILHRSTNGERSALCAICCHGRCTCSSSTLLLAVQQGPCWTASPDTSLLLG